MNRKNGSRVFFGRRGTIRRGLFLFLMTLCLLLCKFVCADSGNLLINGGFENLDASGSPEGWIEDAYNNEEGYTVFSISEGEAKEGGRAASIRNIGANDARFAQTVSVEPESIYRFSGFIRTEGAEGGRGANLSIEGLYAFSESVYDTEGDWKYIEWYGETGEDQRSVTLYARLGGYSGESTGRAWFDDLRLEKVESVPGDGIADLWYSRKTISIFNDDEDEEAGSSSPAWPRLILLGSGYTLAAVLILLRLKSRERQEPESGNMPNSAFFAGLGAALLLRIIISFFVTGYMVDVNCFLSWGGTMASVGPVNFYPATSFCDYPPAYTYILGLNALVCRMIPGISEGMIRIVYRFVPSLCDIFSCLILDRYLGHRRPETSVFSRRAALLLLAFHPLTILNSAAWGQMDSALALLLLLVAIWAADGKWQFALPCYMLAVLVKPQALMLGFLGLAALVSVWFRQKENRKAILRGIAAALGMLAVIVIPFSMKQDPFWIVRQYAGTLGSYPYASVNTANFYYLFNGNWDGIGNPASAAACILLAVFTSGYGICLSLRGRKAWTGVWIESGLAWAFSAWFVYCAVSDASWAMAGSAAMAFAFLVVLGLYIRKKNILFLPYLGGLLFLILFVFGVKMHERYIFPAILLFALAYGLQRDRRILFVLLGLTMTCFLNEGIVLDNSIRLGSAMGHLNADTDMLARLIGVMNCLLTIYAVYAAVETALPEKETEPIRVLLREPEGDNRLHWLKKDTFLLSGVMAVYAFVSLSTLGSMKAPQTAWTSTEYTESVVIDLGEERENFVMLYFARVSRYDFSVAVSPDGESWADETWAQMDQGQCWKWKYVTESTDTGSRIYRNDRHWFSGRYVRITAHQINLALCEVIFRDENGNQLPVLSVERLNGDPTSPLYSDPAALTDEQDSLEGLPVFFASREQGSGDESDPSVPQPSWWNSTYFDEIYHARTAWEFLTASSPYETSHPPLGKVVMSWGIAVFGMTPFGWRFAGALAGILMLAGIYLVIKQTTKNTFLSAFACGLMALDCMHLTQTQIATIDSFPVLFILFAYFFMLRFLQTDWRTEKRIRVLTDLGASGFFMGLSIASKWIGIYAGAGLAVLFFWNGFRYILADRRERTAALTEKPENRNGNASSAGKAFFILCLWCVLFFVMIPAAIYLFSYIPYFAYRRFTSIQDYLEAVLASQVSMLNYHATPGLGMDHPFYSPWYEWPVIGKPMFYATKQYVFTEDLSYSIFCFGNPVIWWLAIPAMLVCGWMWIRNREEKLETEKTGLLSPAPGLDTSLVFLLVGFLAQYLPWMMVPRGTYIYHYFASVPFLIFALTMVFRSVLLRRPRTGKAAAAVFILLAFLAMVLLFPYVTGIYTPVDWLEAGRGLLRIWY